VTAGLAERLERHGLLGIAQAIAGRFTVRLDDLRDPHVVAARGARLEVERELAERGWHPANVARLFRYSGAVPGTPPTTKTPRSACAAAPVVLGAVAQVAAAPSSRRPIGSGGASRHSAQGGEREPGAAVGAESPTHAHAPTPRGGGGSTAPAAPPPRERPAHPWRARQNAEASPAKAAKKSTVQFRGTASKKRRAKPKPPEVRAHRPAEPKTTTAYAWACRTLQAYAKPPAPPPRPQTPEVLQREARRAARHRVPPLPTLGARAWLVVDASTGRPYVTRPYATRADAEAELQELLEPYPPGSMWTARLRVLREGESDRLAREGLHRDEVRV